MLCQFCDLPAQVHMTNVDAATGLKAEVHVCLRHADSTGLPADAVERMTRKMELVRKGMESLQAFVASELRVPSLDEMRAMGLADAILPDDPDDPLFQTMLERLRAMSRMMLEESPPSPGQV